MKILFLHGWQSVPGGVKPTFLAQHGHEVINPNLPDEDFEEAVRIAQEEFDKHQPDVVVGSSRGGAVAMNMNSGSAKLVLLCPAWKKWGTARTVKPGTVILHSLADDVIPFAESVELVRDSGLPASALIEVGTNHRLADQEPLEAMLEALNVDHHGPQTRPIEVEVRFVRQTSEPANYAWVWVRAERSDEQDFVNEAGLEPNFFDGLVKGLRSVLGTKNFRFILTRAKTHPIDSRAFSFQQAGMQAAEDVLKQVASAVE